ncbi:PorP/SprF family type IX secretion system membrane protein [Parapedobacter lycopersici]|uniref:PorP/SprF family type IX secretion system membrane protein n=1 Tax=Parapedobacter lycopersici TaxID=1864939 RepID=UPI00214D8FA6|nr:PorP/SprF family type IX secretion system membrane protein [Parapedobacter lycopersici]
MKQVIMWFFVFWGSPAVFAQQTPLFAEYDYNPFIINPAYAGMAAGSVVSLSHQRYTRNIDGAPRSSAMSIHSPLSNGRMGLGAAIVDDRIGVTTVTDAVLAYSYQLFFDLKRNRPYWEMYDQHVFSFGVTAGMKRLHENLLELGVDDDPAFADNLSEMIPVVGAGFLYNKVGFYIGVSIPNLLGGKLASRNNLNLSTPVYGYFGYRFFTDLYKENMIRPSVLVKYEKGAPVQVDMNLAVTFRNKFEVGAGYRSSSSVNFLVGLYPIERLRVIYHYNVGLKRPVLGNNHGLVLSYAFGYE